MCDFSVHFAVLEVQSAQRVLLLLFTYDWEQTFKTLVTKSVVSV